MTSIFNLDLAEAVTALRDGKLSSRELAEQVIANHDATDGALGAYKSWNPDRIRQNADAADATASIGQRLGPLHGVPVSVKDIYGVRDYPTFAGTPRELPEAWRREGPVVSAVRRQLGVVTGKTHTVEFAFGGIGMNPHWDTPRNPWDDKAHRVPGGSSSGAGVSLATGTAIVALGTDTAGSVRIPASVTGTTGIKTTVGRWSTDGITPLSPSLDTPGILARSASDLALAFLSIDPRHSDPLGVHAKLSEREVAGLRIGICGDPFWDDCSPGVTECVKQALDELAAGGARLSSVELPEAEKVLPIFRKGGLAAAELYAFLSAELPDWLATIDPIVRQRMEEAATLPAYEYLDRLRTLRVASAAAAGRLRGLDVLACPTVAITPPRLEDIAEIDAYRSANLLMLRNTSVVNFLGLSAVTLPVGLDKAGMPVGLQLIGAPNGEEALLSAAIAAERALGTPDRRLGQPPAISR